MSTVTLSKPHCAMTSAENPEGIASQAFTTALLDAQTFLTLFVIGGVSLLSLVVVSQVSNGSTSNDSTLYADLGDADFTSGVYYRPPGIVRQGHAVFSAIGPHFPLGIARDQHGIDACDRFGRPDKIDIA